MNGEKNSVNEYSLNMGSLLNLNEKIQSVKNKSDMMEASVCGMVNKLMGSRSMLDGNSENVKHADPSIYDCMTEGLEAIENNLQKIHEYLSFL